MFKESEKDKQVLFRLNECNGNSNIIKNYKFNGKSEAGII